MTVDLTEKNEQIQAANDSIQLIKREIERVVIGQSGLIDRLLVGLLANGHVLLEGVPGLAKTLTIRTLAQTLRTQFQRIQFTPDLLPADIIGTLIYQPQTGEFTTKKGPIFGNIILADEINRAPAKVQSALLEGMQERQVTIGDTTYDLPDPFFVLATENPIDQEGTYTLPEAQIDRFMLKVVVDYPSKEEERKILEQMAATTPSDSVNAVLEQEQILALRQLVDTIYIDEKIKKYIIDLIFATREPESYQLPFQNLIQFGASPRATIALTLGAKAWALMQGRSFVTPQDVKTIALDVLRHRIMITYEAEAESMTSESLLQEILNTVPVP